MRIAIISDIHGNLEALNAVLTDLDAREAERVVCLGDIVGYGADPQACLDLVRARTGAIVMGNHDKAAFDAGERMFFSRPAREAITWTENRLLPESLDFLRALPMSLSLDTMLIVHASPSKPDNYDYIFSHFEARLHFRDFTERLCFVGHSHVPFVYSEEPGAKEYDGYGRFLINPGSVGQPRDGDWRAAYGMLDTVAGTWEQIRLEYDVRSAATKIRSAGLPSPLADRLLVGQ